MGAPELPRDEAQRLASLHALEILDSPEEEAFDTLTRFASKVFGTNIALISLVDDARQWFLSHHGLSVRETSRDVSFCAHAILMPEEVMVIPDTGKDERFCSNQLVTKAPGIRFYAGAPIVTPDGMPIGTFCIIDTRSPRQMDKGQQALLKQFAEMAFQEIKLRKSRDETEQRNQSLEAQQAQQQQLLSLIGHDLRGSFNAILGFCRILSRLDPVTEPEKVLEYVDIVSRAGDRAHQLMDNLISWTASGFEGKEPVLESADIKGIIANAIGAVRHGAELKGISIVDQSEAARVIVNPRQIEAVVRNLVSNGLKYTPAGGFVFIRTERDGEKVRVIIHDTGEGMDDDTLQLARNPAFGQSHLGTNGEKGSGIGLLLCRNFLKLHQTGLTIESAPGKGSTFSFTLQM